MNPKTLVAFILGNALSASILLAIFVSRFMLIVAIVLLIVSLLPVLEWMIDNWNTEERNDNT